jgi:hypothetical protein
VPVTAYDKSKEYFETIKKPFISELQLELKEKNKYGMSTT